MAVPKVLDMLATLIGEPSVSCTSPALDQSNLGVINQLANWLDELGFATEVMPLPDKPGKANLIARLGGGEGGLVLAGHTDTVPFDDTRWSQDPFAMTERDGRFYGLGSCDMKGFFPLAIAAAAQFADKPLQSPLTIVATSDEESSMAGARYLTECGRPQADYAIIGEPTGAMPVYAHKGFMMLCITLQGASGHSSNPDLGRNALDAMHSVMSELLTYRSELAQQYQNGAFEVSVPTMNLGCLRAGDNPNRICANAELQIDLRLLPGMDSDEVLEELRLRVRHVAESQGTPIDITPLSTPVPPFETPADCSLVRTLEELSGRRAGTVAFGTEGPFLQQLGMETVVFGPGDIDQAHQPDEYLSADRLQPTIDTLGKVIARYCLKAQAT